MNEDDDWKGGIESESCNKVEALPPTLAQGKLYVRIGRNVASRIELSLREGGQWCVETKRLLEGKLGDISRFHEGVERAPHFTTGDLDRARGTPWRQLLIVA